MKKSAFVTIILLLIAVGVNAQIPNSCTATSGTNCYRDTVFSLAANPTNVIICTNTVSTVTATIITNWGALKVTHTNDECDISYSYPPLTNTYVLTNWWVVTAPASHFTNSGAGLTATVTGSGIGTGQIAFNIVYSNGPPCIHVATNQITNTFTVIEVASLAPSNDVAWIEVNIGDPNYRTFIVQRVDGEDPASHVVEIATPNPYIDPTNLPACWSLNGVRTNRMYVDLTIFTNYLITCTAGTSSKTNLIIVEDLPYIIQQPSDVTVALGDTASFSVWAGGTGPLTYQWRLNGVNISGATGTSYSFVPTLAQSGSGIDVVITAPGPYNITSRTATVTVVDANSSGGRANYTYTTADWLNGVSGIKTGSITLDNEGNVLSVSQ